MKTVKQKIGLYGEKQAAKYLRKKGYRILSRNRHLGRNELDLIVRNKEYLVFVEVKTRSFDSPEDTVDRPSFAVDYAKRRRMVDAAFAYFKEMRTTLAPRFDVIEVYLDRSHRMKPFKIHHIPDAFGAGGRLR